jgi:hypothetical protein
MTPARSLRHIWRDRAAIDCVPALYKGMMMSWNRAERQTANRSSQIVDGTARLVVGSEQLLDCGIALKGRNNRVSNTPLSPADATRLCRDLRLEGSTHFFCRSALFLSPIKRRFCIRKIVASARYLAKEPSHPLRRCRGG